MTRPRVRPLVSIVTPTLDQGRFIEQTIRSIMAQSYDHFEHIVIDGGSTDETLDILRRYEGRYPMRWLSEPDEGMYDAINKGMRLATGDILAYLNSDDLYFPWTLEVVVEAFRRRPDADLVFGDALAVGDETGAQQAYLFPPFDLQYIRERGLIAQPAVFWRRRVVNEEGLFDTSLRYVADCDYWMRVGERQRFHKVNEFLAVERDHAGTLRLSTEDGVWDELCRVRARYAAGNQLSARLRALRARALFRRDWLLLLLHSSLPRPIDRGPWARMIASGHLMLSPASTLAMMVPLVGGGYRRRALAPSRHWLDLYA